MAEISLVASIIAVIQITTSVARQAHKYGQSVKNATEDITKILDELKDIESILVKLKDLVDRETKDGKLLDSWPTLVSLKNPDGALEHCRLAMTSLCDELTPAEGFARFTQRARWPPRKKKIEQRLESIKKSKDTFLTLLNVEHIGQSLETAHMVTQVSKIHIDDKRSEIIRWLSKNIDPDVNQNAARKKHEDNTGKWFTESKEYFSWKDEPNSFLWLHGIPGCGKTILCSEIIEQTRKYCKEQPEDRVLAYFYFSFRDSEKQKVANLLSSVLSQLVRQAEFIPQPVRILYDNYLHSQPPADRLLSAIESMINGHRNTFIIIDALDECPSENGERRDLCNALGEIKEWAASNLHLLVTSRREAALIESLEPLCTIDSISIQGAAVQSDIQKFVRSELSIDRRLQKWPADIQDDIEKSLVRGANGMFRWVELQLDSLKKCITPSDVKRALKSLPTTLSETYDRILFSIDERHREKALIALQWISYACQPVGIEELAEAVIIDPTVTPSFNPRDRIPDPDWLLEILSGLVITSKSYRSLNFYTLYDPKHIPTVALAHFSVKEYLNSREILSGPARIFHILEASAIECIVQRCLLYIMCYSVSDSKSDTSQDLYEFPLLLYASHFWHEHLLAAEDTITTETKNLVFDFLGSKRSLSAWFLLYRPDDEGFDIPFSTTDCDIGCPLYYLALLGILNLVRDLMNTGIDVNAQGGRYGTALAAAAYNDNINIVKLLIEAGADVNAHGGVYGTPLVAGSWNGSIGAMKLLLEAGASINANDGKFGTALATAAGNGNMSAVKLLIDAGVDINTQDGHYGTALMAAARFGYTSGVELLLDAGADVNARSRIYGTALYTAAYFGEAEIVAMLLEAGADVNALGGSYGTAIQATITGVQDHPETQIEILELLLTAGADVNVLDEDVRTMIRKMREMRTTRDGMTVLA